MKAACKKIDSMYGSKQKREVHAGDGDEMKYTVPDYYQDFECIAGECPATCCAGWQIVIDERSLKRYKNYKGSFGSRLANSIDWEEGTFLQYNGRCAFLDENNLCDIYTEAGPHMFCRTCRNYPRHIEEFENEREISLSLSCPVAAEMILGRKEKVRFISAEKECQEEEDEEFDFFLYSALQDCRSVMIDILQDRDEPISFRMAKVLALAHDVQNRIDARRIFEVETLLERYQRAGANEKLKVKFASYNENAERKVTGKSCEEQAAVNKHAAENRTAGAIQRSRGLLGLLDELEVLDPSWTAQLKRYREVLYGDGEAGYDKAVKRAESSSLKNGITAFETELEQLMVYFIFTYFCGAVYDGDAFAKAKMAVVCTLMLRELWIADWMLLESMEGGTRMDSEAGDIKNKDAVEVDEKECVGKKENEEKKVELTQARNRVAWRFSRELEHSDPNLDKMEELMNEREEASFETLLRMIFDN